MSSSRPSERRSDARRLVVAGAAADRLAAAGDWLARRVPAEEALVLASTWAAASELLRGLGGRLGVHRGTPWTLASELAARPLAENGRTPVTGPGLEALALRAAAEPGGELEVLAPVVSAPGFGRRLAATVGELRLAGFAPADLAQEGASTRDLGRLLAAYERELESWRLADRADVLRAAVQQVDGAGHWRLGAPLLLLDLDLRLGLERDLIEAVAGAAPRVLATAIAGDARGIAFLERCLGVEAEVVDAGVEPRSSLGRVRRYVFATEAPVVGADSPEVGDGELRLFSAPGESREAAEIARRVRDLAADGERLDRMAILLRHPDGQLAAVEEALTRARIPAYFTRGTVRPDPAGRAFLALLACSAEGVSASRFAEYLSFGQVPAANVDASPGAAGPVEAADSWVPPNAVHPNGGAPSWVAPDGEGISLKAPGGPAPGVGVVGDPAEPDVVTGGPRTPRYWERLLVDAAVVGGVDRWRRRLDGLGGELRARIRDVDDGPGPRRRRFEADLRRLDELRAFALPLVDLLGSLPESAPWGEWIDRLGGLAVRALAQPERVRSLLAELVPMAPVGPVTLDDVRRTLAPRLTQLRAEPPDSPYGRIFVGTADEARGRCFAAVFLPGLAEGGFPRPASEDPLLLDAARRDLGADGDTAPGGGLETQEDRIADERLRLRIAAGAAERLLVVSYPSLDLLQGRARVPSFYALDLLRAAEGRVPRLASLERRAAAAAPALLGWPAPVNPDDAVDEVEYDLAVLQPLLVGPRGGGKGSARYLLELNPHLDRSLRSRWERWHAGSFRRGDGLVGPKDPELVAALERFRPSRSAHAPTALEAFAACPYRYLLRAVHRLRPREEPEPLERLDPRTRGRLIHEVQSELLRELRADGLVPLSRVDVDSVLARADLVLERVAGRFAADLAPAIERVWREEIAEISVDLRGWIRHVASQGGSWQPLHTELAFGLSPSPGGADDPASVAEPVVVLERYPLRGRIDLVEEEAPATAPATAPRTEPETAAAPEEAGEGGAAGASVRVTDHKTGRAVADTELVVGGGETLQPVLYALAAEGILGRPVRSGRLFFCTRKGHYQAEPAVPLDGRARKDAQRVLDTVDAWMSRAFLPAAPREDACRTCDYRTVCGPHEERRTARKRREQLLELEQLRRMR